MSSGVCFSLNSATLAKSPAKRVKNVCKGARELNREREGGTKESGLQRVNGSWKIALKP